MSERPDADVTSGLSAVPEGIHDASWFGASMRAAREKAGLSQRELARRLSLSPGMISQLEKGHTQPSVTTLLAVARLLDVSLDSLFIEDQTTRDDLPAGRVLEPAGGQGPDTGSHRHAFGPVASRELVQPLAQPGIEELIARRGARSVITMGSGVTWELLTPDQHQPVLFMLVTYPAGASTNADGEFVRHTDLEYFYMLEGELDVYIEFEHARLRADDSMWFDSSRPHNFVNNSQVDARGVWCLLPGR